VYKKCNIFYGLGNALFKQGHYYDGRLRFPSYCENGLCVSWDIETNCSVVADISFVESKGVLGSFVKPSHHDKLMSISNFAGLSHSSYVEYFRAHRVKKKGLPIFHEHDDSVQSKVKATYVKLRALILSFAFNHSLINYKK